MQHVRLLAIALVAIFVPLIVGCRDDDDDDIAGDTTPADAATDEPTETVAPTDTVAPTQTDEREETDAAPSDVSVTIEGFSFDPSDFTVPASQAVTFNVDNLDSAGHTFTVYTDAGVTQAQGVDVSLGGQASGSAEGTFGAATYFFRCDIHPSQMQGTFTAE